MNFDHTCTISWISRDLPHQVWEAQSADGIGAYTIFTRFLHNKVLFWANNISRCYFSYLSPDYIAKQFTIVGLLIIIILLWYLISRKKIKLLILLMLLPLLLVFS